VFLDEIDAVGSRRGTSFEGQRDREQTLNQILVELDGFEDRSGVIVLAASNRPEILDPALVRPGRFDRTVTIGLPDRRGRAAILAVHAEGKRLGANVDLDVVAAMTSGFSGADLANVMNEATLLAARQRRGDVGMELVEEAVERVGMGVSRAQLLSHEDRAMVAYHEVGHALVGRALPGARSPRKVSIVARGRALGATWNLDEANRVVRPKSVLIDQMAGLLGGRAAEELVFGEPGSGAADDLERVGQIARQMVCEFGMSEALGQLAYGQGADGPPRRYSEEAAATIDTEIRRLVDIAYGRAQAVLAASTTALDRAARALLERETLSAEELDELCATALDGELPSPAPSASR
jgi:cell division protease FtsH